MSIDQTPPTAEELGRRFGKTSDVPPRTFEFALVMRGTPSAGSYTAGAVDFFIEAHEASDVPEKRLI